MHKVTVLVNLLLGFAYDDDGAKNNGDLIQDNGISSGRVLVAAAAAAAGYRGQGRIYYKTYATNTV